MGSYANQPEFATIASAVTPTDTFSAATKVDGAALYIGTGGNVAVVMKNIEGTTGNAIVFKNVPDGTFLPAIVDYVIATGTTATDIVAVY
jgi:hypothetical protein|tara:strand:- start:694 stop:963 length:270 start_codon:yes stop_codon:yes gene_type:complete